MTKEQRAKIEKISEALKGFIHVGFFAQQGKVKIFSQELESIIGANVLVYIDNTAQNRVTFVLEYSDYSKLNVFWNEKMMIEANYGDLNDLNTAPYISSSYPSPREDSVNNLAPKTVATMAVLADGFETEVWLKQLQCVLKEHLNDVILKAKSLEKTIEELTGALV